MAEGERHSAEGFHQARVLRDIAARIERGETPALPPEDFDRLVRVFVHAVNSAFARDLREQLDQVKSERAPEAPHEDD